MIKNKTKALLVLFSVFSVSLALNYMQSMHKASNFNTQNLVSGFQTDFSNHVTNIPMLLENPKLTYLGQGKRCICFETQDKKYVFKFFKHKSSKTHSHKKIQHLLYEMTNYARAFEKIPHLTALVALHLNAKAENLPIVTLIDNKGISHQIDLNLSSFIVQKKALLFQQRMLLAKSSQEKTELINSMKELLKLRASLGFSEIRKSLSMERNYGFIGSEPIQFDLGNMCYFEEIEKNPEHETIVMTQMFDKWLQNNKF